MSATHKRTARSFAFNEDNDLNKVLRSTITAAMSFYKQKLAEAGTSHMLLETIGHKNENARIIEAFLSDPVRQIISAHGTLSDVIAGIAKNHIVARFFSYHDPVISKVYMKTGTKDHLYFAVVLKNDTFRNRNKILGFFDYYNGSDLADVCSIYFQFMTSEIAARTPDLLIFDYVTAPEPGKA